MELSTGSDVYVRPPPIADTEKKTAPPPLPKSKPVETKPPKPAPAKKAESKKAGDAKVQANGGVDVETLRFPRVKLAGSRVKNDQFNFASAPKEKKLTFEEIEAGMSDLRIGLMREVVRGSAEIHTGAHTSKFIHPEAFMELYHEVYTEALDVFHEGGTHATQEAMEGVLREMYAMELLAAFSHGGGAAVDRYIRKKYETALHSAGVALADGWIENVKKDTAERIAQETKEVELDMFGRPVKRRARDANIGAKRRERDDVEEEGKYPKRQLRSLIETIIAQGRSLQEQVEEIHLRAIKETAGYDADDDVQVLWNDDAHEESSPDMHVGQGIGQKRSAGESDRYASPIARVLQYAEDEEDEEENEVRAALLRERDERRRILEQSWQEEEEEEAAAFAQRDAESRAGSLSFSQLVQDAANLPSAIARLLPGSGPGVVHAAEKQVKGSGFLWKLAAAPARLLKHIFMPGNAPITYKGKTYVINKTYMKDGKETEYTPEEMQKLRQGFKELQDGRSAKEIEAAALNRVDGALRDATEEEAVAAYLAWYSTILFRVSATATITTATADFISPNSAKVAMQNALKLSDVAVSQHQKSIDTVMDMANKNGVNYFSINPTQRAGFISDINVQRAKEGFQAVAEKLTEIRDKVSVDLAFQEGQYANLLASGKMENIVQAENLQLGIISAYQKFLDVSSRGMEDLSPEELTRGLTAVGEHMKTPIDAAAFTSLQESMRNTMDSLQELRGNVQAAAPFTTDSPTIQALANHVGNMFGETAGTIMKMQVMEWRSVEETIRLTTESILRGGWGALAVVGVAIANSWQLVFRLMPLGLAVLHAWQGDIGSAMMLAVPSLGGFVDSLRKIIAGTNLRFLVFIFDVGVQASWSFLAAGSILSVFYLLQATLGSAVLALGGLGAFTFTSLSVIAFMTWYFTRIRPWKVLTATAMYFLRNPREVFYVGLALNMAMYVLTFMLDRYVNLTAIQQLAPSWIADSNFAIGEQMMNADRGMAQMQLREFIEKPSNNFINVVLRQGFNVQGVVTEALRRTAPYVWYFLITILNFVMSLDIPNPSPFA